MMYPWQPATAADADTENMVEKHHLRPGSRLELVGQQFDDIRDKLYKLNVYRVVVGFPLLRVRAYVFYIFFLDLRCNMHRPTGF